MSKLQDHRDAIVAKMNSVANIGIVHSFERYAAREKDFRDHFMSGGEIRGWVVRRIRTIEKAATIGRWDQTFIWEIRGYMSLDDDGQSELVFDELVEALRDAFRTDETLGGAVDTTIVPERAGLEVQGSGPVMFAGFLCHSVRLALTTTSCE